MPTPPRLVFYAALALGLLAVGLLAAACRPQTGRMDRVLESGMLRVALDPSFPPFESVDGNGQIVGLDADLAQAIAGHLGVEAHLVTTSYDALYDALTADRADVIISALYPDPARSADFAFSSPYFDAGLVLVTLDGAAIGSEADLAGQTVACVFGTAGHMQALQWQETLDPPPTVITVEDPDTIMALLQSYAVGTAVRTEVRTAANAVVIDYVSARVAQSQDAGLRIITPTISPEPYVIAARSEDEALIEVVEDALQALQADGTLDALSEQWLKP